MISIQSLSEELLPNVYVKSVNLDTNYELKLVKASKNTGFGANVTESNQLVPSESSSSKVTLSCKFLNSPELQSDLALLLSSELQETIKIYVHQVTDEGTYDELVATANKTILTTNNSNLDNVTTIEDSLLKEVDVETLPEQILDNGILLREVINNFTFNFPNETDFLAYIIVVALKLEDVDDVFISAPRKEIVILNGELQNKGIVFTIASFPGGGNNQELAKFGNPGDIWTGAVHYNELIPGQDDEPGVGRFMAGATHSDVPHPFLDYSFQTITKFVDNRIQDKIERSIIDVTKTLETLNSLTSRYQNSARNDLLDFKNKQQTFISDIYLSQDKEGNIGGSFVIDKTQLIKTYGALSFLCTNAEQLYKDNTSLYNAFNDRMMAFGNLMECSVQYNGSTIGSLSEEEASKSFDYMSNASPTQGFNFYKDGFSLLPKSSDDNINGIQYFSFKHSIAKSSDVMHEYSVTVEYKDPTIDFVKSISDALKPAVKQLDQLINYVDKNPPKELSLSPGKSISGFDPVTKKLKDALIAFLKAPGSPIPILQDTVLEASVPQAVLNLPYSDLAVLFYNGESEITVSDLSTYIKSLINIDVATIDSLLIASKFLSNLQVKIQSILESFGVKSSKDSVGTPYGNITKKGNSDSKVATKTIKTTSNKPSHIKVYDYGYDFTGIIDNSDLQESALNFDGRNHEQFLNILSSDYYKACIYSFSEIGNILAEGTGAVFKPIGIPQRTIKSALFSYLNTPAIAPAVLQSSIVLPATIANLNSEETKATNILTAIQKLKNEVLENNSKGLSGQLNSPLSLKEDMITLLARQGVSVPSVEQSEFSRATVSQTDQSSETDRYLKNAKPAFDPKIGSKNNSFRIQPRFTKQTSLKVNNDISANNLLNSLINRNNFTNVKNNYSFKLEFSKSDFVPIESALGSLIIAPPVQTLCLSLEDDSSPSFKNFKSGDGVTPLYVKSGVVNPTLLAYFWFIHQNIVRVEYLSGYETTKQQVFTKNKQNPYSVGEVKTISHRNVNKPKWRRMSEEVLSSMELEDKVLCRLVRYKNPKYINQHLVAQYDMPLINSHFTIEKKNLPLPIPTTTPGEPIGIDLLSQQQMSSQVSGQSPIDLNSLPTAGDAAPGGPGTPAPSGSPAGLPLPPIPGGGNNQ